MYLPRQFEETRVQVLHELIRSHPLGALVTLTPTGLCANHIPFEVDPEPGPFGTLRGHVARANSVWRDHNPEIEALVCFQGPDTYISPSWYVTKQETGKVVPTWNYAVVHVHGNLRVIEDRLWLRGLVDRLTDRHEADNKTAWQISDAPADFLDKQLAAIVGLEIPITRLVGKWKVSQNRPQRDRAAVAAALDEHRGEAAAGIASLVRQYSERDAGQKQD
jgi:transcriptional regulator